MSSDIQDAIEAMRNRTTDDSHIMTVAQLDDRVKPLEAFFAIAWRAFLDGGGFEGPELEDAIETAGLGVWRPATEAEIEQAREDDEGRLEGYEVGDPIMHLTDAGKAAMDAVRAARKLEPPT